MAIEIEIQYPKESVASQEEINAIKKHETALKEKLVIITLTTFEKYLWIVDESMKPQRYFALKNSNGIVFSKSINTIKNSKPENFIYELEREAVFQKHKGKD